MRKGQERVARFETTSSDRKRMFTIIENSREANEKWQPEFPASPR